MSLRTIGVVGGVIGTSWAITVISTVGQVVVRVFALCGMSYPFGKEPNQKKYLSATVQLLERNATQSFNIV